MGGDAKLTIQLFLFAEWILDGTDRLHFTLLPNDNIQFEVVQLISKVRSISRTIGRSVSNQFDLFLILISINIPYLMNRTPYYYYYFINVIMLL